MVVEERFFFLPFFALGGTPCLAGGPVGRTMVRAGDGDLEGGGESMADISAEKGFGVAACTLVVSIDTRFAIGGF